MPAIKPNRHKSDLGIHDGRVAESRVKDAKTVVCRVHPVAAGRDCPQVHCSDGVVSDGDLVTAEGTAIQHGEDAGRAAFGSTSDDREQSRAHIPYPSQQIKETRYHHVRHEKKD